MIGSGTFEEEGRALTHKPQPKRNRSPSNDNDATFSDVCPKRHDNSATPP